MRSSSLLIFLLLATASGSAQNMVSVAEFDQALTGVQHLRDKEAAKAIAGMTLKERASADDQKRWQAEFKGQRARRALTAVSDISLFLAPPPDAISDVPAPPMPEQVKIVEKALSYIKQTLPRLPNLLAVRTTTRFEVSTHTQLDEQLETSKLYQLNNWEPKYQTIGKMQGQSLYFGGDWQSVVAYRDGQEVSEPHMGTNNHPPPLGLETKGEFGPILITVVGDALKGSITWSRWERGAQGKLAVFHYNVPHEASHYRVENVMDGSIELPPYHGEIAVDPATGAIYRITLTAEGSKSSAARESSILVEYGPMVIGGKTYICPLHGVAYSQPHLVDATGKLLPEDKKTKAIPHYLNDATFTQYRLFRSEVRILTDDGQH